MMHHSCTPAVQSVFMETDLMNVRRWLFEDFKSRVALLVPPLLQGNPTMGACDLMAAIEIAESPRPLKPHYKAYLLDQFLVTRWAGETPPAPTHVRRRPKNPVSPKQRRIMVPV